jgi:hypothetical protein
MFALAAGAGVVGLGKTVVIIKKETFSLSTFPARLVDPAAVVHSVV